MKRLITLAMLPALIVIYALLHQNRAPRRPHVAGPWWAGL